jgi:hypothetical protein
MLFDVLRCFTKYSDVFLVFADVFQEFQTILSCFMISINVFSMFHQPSSCFLVFQQSFVARFDSELCSQPSPSAPTPSPPFHPSFESPMKLVYSFTQTEPTSKQHDVLLLFNSFCSNINCFSTRPKLFSSFFFSHSLKTSNTL